MDEQLEQLRSHDLDAPGDPHRTVTILPHSESPAGAVPNDPTETPANSPWNTDDLLTRLQSRNRPQGLNSENN